jgi:hypothetical protein
MSASAAPLTHTGQVEDDVGRSEGGRRVGEIRGDRSDPRMVQDGRHRVEHDQLVHLDHGCAAEAGRIGQRTPAGSVPRKPAPPVISTRIQAIYGASSWSGPSPA